MEVAPCPGGAPDNSHAEETTIRARQLGRFRPFRRRPRLVEDMDRYHDLFGATEGTTVLKQVKENDLSRLLAKIVVVGVLAAFPMAAVAAPAAAAAVSGVVQVDRNGQHPRGGDDDQDDQQDENELNPFGGLLGESNPFGDMFGDMFGGSNPFGGLLGESNPFGDMFGSS
ncbi:MULTISPECIES: hypothetical protein [Rhodococcus]|uniref:hypothetical protein n=1 Tax=Rhodococcus TaxID=1827 RepID=UPI00117A5607|nr:hypothetical protein [Rhodococcus sp. ACS1]